MIRNVVLTFFVFLHIVPNSVYGQTCQCATITLNGETSCVAAAANTVCSPNVCSCSRFSATNCPSSADCVFPVPGSGSNFNFCECQYNQDYQCFATANNNCSASEFCACDLISQEFCTSNGSGSAINCIVVQAIGDPHFLGFDNRKFDFHGVHGNSYLVYAEDKGDVLTAKVRATPEIYNGYNKTYFHEFGLQVFGSPQKIHLFLAQIAERTWGVQVTVNFEHVKSDVKLQNCELVFNPDGRSVTILTRKNKFIVTGVSLKSKFRRHLDFKLKKGPIVKSDRYSGVLGMTLSRRMGSSIHEEVIGRGREKQFEMKLREQYGLKSMFPSRAELSIAFKD